MDEETKKPEVQLVESIHPNEDTGFIAIVLPPEYIHWMGFVVSFLLMVIASVFLKYDDFISAGGAISPIAYIDMLLMSMATISCIRCIYRYIKAWFNRRNDEDDDDPDFMSGSTHLMGGDTQAHV